MTWGVTFSLSRLGVTLSLSRHRLNLDPQVPGGK
jgi:hypothetical protein